MKYAYTFEQLREELPTAADRRFLDYERTVKCYGGVDTALYHVVHFGAVEEENEREACERIFWAYNSDVRPAGYEGRSMSASDIVTLWNNNREPPVKSVWFCDSVGFEQLACSFADARMCPVCGKEYTDRPAVSRLDDETSICPDCGTREALEGGGGRP